MSVFSKMLAVSSINKIHVYKWYRYVRMSLEILLRTHNMAIRCIDQFLEPSEVEGHEFLSKISFLTKKVEINFFDEKCHC